MKENENTFIRPPSNRRERRAAERERRALERRDVREVNRTLKRLGLNLLDGGKAVRREA